MRRYLQPRSPCTEPASGRAARLIWRCRRYSPIPGTTCWCREPPPSNWAKFRSPARYCRWNWASFGSLKRTGAPGSRVQTVECWTARSVVYLVYSAMEALAYSKGAGRGGGARTGAASTGAGASHPISWSAGEESPWQAAASPYSYCGMPESLWRSERPRTENWAWPCCQRRAHRRFSAAAWWSAARRTPAERTAYRSPTADHRSWRAVWSRRWGSRYQRSLRCRTGAASSQGAKRLRGRWAPSP